MNHFLLSKTRLTAIILLGIFLLTSSCQEIQAPTPTPAATEREVSQTIPPNFTNTPSKKTTKTPVKTPTPAEALRTILKSGTPLPSNLNKITIENAEIVQHLATWGEGSPNDLQLSKDGQVLAVGTNIGVTLYDSLGFSQLTFKSTPHPVMTIAFSPDNEFFAVGQFGGLIDVYYLSDLTFVTRLEISEWPLEGDYKFDCFFYQETNQLISIIRTDQKILINQWSTDHWKKSEGFSIDKGITSFINRELGLIGVISEDQMIFQSLIYQPDKTQIPLPKSLPEKFWEDLAENFGDIAPTSNGEYLMINDGSSIRRWKITTDMTTYHLTDFPPSLPEPCQNIASTCLNKDDEISWVCQETVKPPIETIALTPDNIMILISRNDNTLELRRAHDGLLAWEVEASYIKIRFSPGSEFFFGLREDGVIEKRRSENGILIGTIDHHPGELKDISLSPDSGEIAVGFNDGWIRIFSTEDGQILGRLEANANALSYSPDGSLLAAGLPDGTVRVFTLENGGHFDLEGHRGAVNDLVFSENGQVLLSGSDDCTIRLWDVFEKRRTKTIIPGKEFPFQVLRVAFSPVESLGYMVGDINGLVAAKEDAKYSIEGFISVRDIAISEDQQTLAVTGSGTSIFPQIDEQGFSKAYLLSTSGNTLVLNEDGSLLIIGTDDSLEFWSVKDRIEIQEIPQKNQDMHGSIPIRVVISPDNTMIALGYQNGLIDIFGIPDN